MERGSKVVLNPEYSVCQLGKKRFLKMGILIIIKICQKHIKLPIHLFCSIISLHQLGKKRFELSMIYTRRHLCKGTQVLHIEIAFLLVSETVLMQSIAKIYKKYSTWL